MKVTRFMSRLEWDKLQAGQTITNNRKHKAKTTSVGFCFTEDEPQVAWKYLGGIVDAEVCVTFDFPEGFLTESTAKYADQREGAEFGYLMDKRELCCTEYSLDDAKVVCVIDPFMGVEYRELKEIVDSFIESEMTLDDLEDCLNDLENIKL